MLIALTLLSLLPAILLSCTAFTKILVVLGLTRNALGLQQTPPNQVLAGLALFLSLFIMAPVLSEINDVALQPYLDGEKTAAVAVNDGIEPLRDFMLDNTDDDELELLTNVADRDLPENREDVSTATLVPAFVLSELKQAFIIGFIIFIPFLVIDIVVSGALMALGMMMMPPVMVSLPFKLLLFVLVDGWALVVQVPRLELRVDAMTDTAIIEIALQTMVVALKLSAPILVTSLVIGFTISLFQSMTQIQEFTLSFVPKLVGVGVALLICGNWMLHTLVTFTEDLFDALPALLG